MCPSWHFSPNECQTFCVETEAKIIRCGALADAVITIAFYVKSGILFTQWTPDGMGSKMDCHASEAARPQRITRLMQLLLGPAQQSTHRFGCALSKVSSQKSGSWGWPQEMGMTWGRAAPPASHCHAASAPGTLPLSEPPPEALQLSEAQTIHPTSVWIPPCQLQTEPDDHGIHKLGDFISILGLLRDSVCSVVLPAQQ